MITPLCRNAMRLGTLNLGHQTVPSRTVPEGLLDALVNLELDLLFLTEYVNADEYLVALSRRWRYYAASIQVSCAPRRYLNQVAVLSRFPVVVRDGLEAVPTECARTNFLSVEVNGWILTGVRAPAYKRAGDCVLVSRWDKVEALGMRAVQSLTRVKAMIVDAESLALWGV